MLFQEEHIKQIRTGEKTATRRQWSDDYTAGPEPGDVRMATTELFVSDDECDCYIVVTHAYEQRLGDMTEADARKEGGYTLGEFRDVWEAVTGDPWDPDEVVDVIEFVYVGRDRPPVQQYADSGGESRAD